MRVRLRIPMRQAFYVSMMCNVLLLAVVAWLAYEVTKPAVPMAEYEELKKRLEELERRWARLMEVVPKYPVEISFEPNGTQIVEFGDVVTYISGMLVVSGLSSVPYRPIDVSITFALMYRLSRPELGFRINWDRGYVISNITSMVLDVIRAPWSAFPVIIEHSQPGDWIQLQIHIFVEGRSGDVPVMAARGVAYILIVVR